jgi:hypothetical protein
MLAFTRQLWTQPASCKAPAMSVVLPEISVSHHSWFVRWVQPCEPMGSGFRPYIWVPRMLTRGAADASFMVVLATVMPHSFGGSGIKILVDNPAPVMEAAKHFTKTSNCPAVQSAPS